jgi:hypothetical protein
MDQLDEVNPLCIKANSKLDTPTIAEDVMILEYSSGNPQVGLDKTLHFLNDIGCSASRQAA